MPDWREGARAEYREKRAALVKNVASAVKAEARAVQRRTEYEQQLADLDAGARAFGLEVDPAGQPSPEPKPPHDDGQVPVKDIVLRALARQHPLPLRAKALRAIIEAELGRAVHYKTPGMTLYRLAENRLVRREGLDWYATDDGILDAGLNYQPSHPDDPPEYDPSEMFVDEETDAVTSDPHFADDYLEAKGRL